MSLPKYKHVKCEKCYHEGETYKMKLSWIQLYSGHVYHACIKCRKDLRGYFKFRKDLNDDTTRRNISNRSTKSMSRLWSES
jgi:hypothetical protein